MGRILVRLDLLPPLWGIPWVPHRQGPLAASTRAHERRGHSGPRSSVGQFTVYGFSSKKDSEPLGPVKHTQQLYGLAAKNLESVTS